MSLSPQTCEALITRYGLGNRIVSIEATAESHNSVWKLTTDRNAYAIKQLNTSDQKRIDRCRRSQGIAQSFKQGGVSVVSAISVENDCTTRIDDDLFVVYEWVDGSATATPVTPEARNRIASLLAQIHAADIDVESRELQTPPTCDPKLLDALPDSEKRKELAEIVDATNRHVPQLGSISEPSVVSHTDLNTSNVLWSDNEPCLIDWDEAGPAYYSLDVVSTAMMWCRSAERTLDAEAYGSFLSHYRKRYNGPYELNTSFALWHTLGWGLDWLAYNLGHIQSQPSASNEATKYHRAAALQTDLVISTHSQKDIIQNVAS